jgi:hypothetical protein
MIQDKDEDHAAVIFQFTLFDDFIRGPLEAFLAGKENVTTETVFEIVYFDSNPPPGKLLCDKFEQCIRISVI